MDNFMSGTVLPASLFDVYLRYKQSTRAIVKWLSSFVSDPQIQYSYTIKDLQRLSKIVCAKKEPLPDLISFHFREAIRNRERLSHRFRKIDDSVGNEFDTFNHEFFTQRLREIYANLCGVNERAGRKQDHCHHQKHDEQQNGVGSKCPYDLLEVDSCGDEALIEDYDAQLREQASKLRDCDTKKGKTPDLADDGLSQKLELLNFMKELDETLMLVRQVWKQAAQREVPIALAAFTTSTAFVSLKAHETQFRVLHDAPETGEKRRSSVGSPETDPVIRQIMLMHGSNSTKRVHETYTALEELRARMFDDDKEQRKVQSCQRASEYLSSTWDPSSEQDRRSVSALFSSITELACCKKNSDVVRCGTPLALDLARFIDAKNDGADANSLGLKGSIGIQLLLHGFESFTWPDVGGAMIQNHPRLQSLRFAREVADSINEVLEDKTMPCRCCFTLASNLENFEKDLEIFLRERRFDLFMQSPWASGSHMLEILETSFYYSMRLCSYKHLFGSLLHLYNCLSGLGQMEKIPLLELFCDMFEDVVFPGGRPKVGFRVSFLRLKGGRLKQSREDRKQWNLAVSQYSAREVAGFGFPRQPVDSRFRYEKTSLLHLIKSKGFQIDKSAWQNFSARLRQVSQPTEKTKGASPPFQKKHEIRLDGKAEHGTMPCDSCLLELQEVIGRSELMPSESNPLPTGRINYFKVYLAAVGVLREISEATHEEPPAGGVCTCVVDTILRRGDAFNESHLSMTPEGFGCKEAVQACKRAMLKEFDLAREKWDSLLWEHL